jgi:hypothetical protein
MTVREPIRISHSPADFERYIGIDYSGAQAPISSLRGLRVYMADRTWPPVEMTPPPSPRKYWTRRGVAEWLVERLSEDKPALVGIDHGFSFPLQCFKKYGLAHHWLEFLKDFQRHWPTDMDYAYVEFALFGDLGNGPARMGERSWRRLTEIRARTAKSVFFFDANSSAGKSTHAGLPWLLYIRHQLSERVHFWPFDGWEIPNGKSVIAEVYPLLLRQGERLAAVYQWKVFIKNSGE